MKKNWEDFFRREGFWPTQAYYEGDNYQIPRPAGKRREVYYFTRLGGPRKVISEFFGFKDNPLVTTH